MALERKRGMGEATEISTIRGNNHTLEKEHTYLFLRPFVADTNNNIT